MDWRVFRGSGVSSLMSAIGSLLLVAPCLSFLMFGAWLVARLPGKSGWADVIWSYAVGAGGVFLALTGTQAPLARRLLVALLVGVWSVRLGSHILRRTLKGADDPRYLELHRKWGARWQFRLLIFLQVQAAAAFILLIGADLASRNPARALAWSDGAGAVLALIAVGGEWLADRQLREFAADPVNKGKVNDRGLWAWSRHPNYFFEWLGWWAYPLIAIGPGAEFGWGWAALVSPALMYVLLVHASGIPPTEAHMMRSRGAAFQAYRNRVNAFFPGPARSEQR